MVWLEFIFSSAIIVYAGVRLTQYADQLSDQIKISKFWIGIVLLGFITSLPEAITCLVSIISLEAYDLALGNIMGSNVFNPLLIVIMDAFYRKGSVTDEIHVTASHRYSASCAIMLVLLVVIDLKLHSKGQGFEVGMLSAGSIVIILMYFFSLQFLSRIQKKSADGDDNHISDQSKIRPLLIKLGISAACVTIAAIWLTNTADVIADVTGLGRTFVGSLFLALVTSLPEMVVTISALKLGALDLAIGNIFGSNMTNIAILAFCDLFSPQALLKSVSFSHTLTALNSILLVMIVLVGIQKKNKKTFFGLGWDSYALLLFFLFGTGLLYQIK